MKRICLVLLALALVFGSASVCLGQGDPLPGMPEMRKASNMQKGQKVMKLIRAAERRFFQGFPECYAIDGVWGVNEYGYNRTFYRGSMQNRKPVRALVTYEGVLMYAFEDGIYNIIE